MHRTHTDFERLLLDSPVMEVVADLCRRYGRVARPIIFVGPVGSGKTTLARYLHHAAGSLGHFVTVSAGELDEGLFQSTLFGHVRGAFTGAIRAHDGAVARARAGTLLLDDLALLSPVVQAALLRLIEERRYRPVGARDDAVVECRLIFASTAPPHELAERGDLLPDLPSRLGELMIRVPPLRARGGEIPVLALTAMRAMADELGIDRDVTIELSDEVRDRFQRYAWPGNLRELKQVCDYAAIHSAVRQGCMRIRLANLPERFRTSKGPDEPVETRLTTAAVHAALKASSGNKTAAARILGVHRNTISRRLRA